MPLLEYFDNIIIYFRNGMVWVVLEGKVPFRVLSTRVPYYVGRPQKNPNVEKDPNPLVLRAKREALPEPWHIVRLGSEAIRTQHSLFSCPVARRVAKALNPKP